MENPISIPLGRGEIWWNHVHLWRRRLLNLLRATPTEAKMVLVCRRPHREWGLAQLPATRNGRLKLLDEPVFTSLAEAEWYIFKLRWQQHTGETLD